MRRLAIVVLLTVLGLAGADVTGSWTFEVNTDAGSGTPSFVLKQQGKKLSGTYEGALGKADVAGTVKGSDVVIEFDASEIHVRYAGTVESDGRKMKGSVDLGGQARGTFTAGKK